MPYDLEGIIQHVRAQGRSGTHQAVLVGEIERLRAEVARLESQIRINAEAHFRPLLGEFHRGMAAAAAIADIYETENFRLAQDTILTDPVLSGRDRSSAAWAVSERLQSDATIHSSMAHAARNIAEAIRGAAKEISDV